MPKLHTRRDGLHRGKDSVVVDLDIMCLGSLTVTLVYPRGKGRTGTEPIGGCFKGYRERGVKDSFITQLDWMKVSGELHAPPSLTTE